MPSKLLYLQQFGIDPAVECPEGERCWWCNTPTTRLVLVETETYKAHRLECGNCKPPKEYTVTEVSS